GETPVGRRRAARKFGRIKRRTRVPETRVENNGLELLALHALGTVRLVIQSKIKAAAKFPKLRPRSGDAKTDAFVFGQRLVENIVFDLQSASGREVGRLREGLVLKLQSGVRER